VVSYRELWQSRWAEQAVDLRHLAAVAEGLGEDQARLTEWYGELLELLGEARRQLLEDDLTEGLTLLGEVAKQLQVEAGEDGQTWADMETAEYLSAELTKLEYQAGAWGEGYD
jgi:hypothetical protein